MKCENCGNELTGKENFCQYCGEPNTININDKEINTDSISQVGKTSNSKKCKYCNNNLLGDELFCPYCGNSLKKTKKTNNNTKENKKK